MHLRDGLQTHATVRQRYDHLAGTGALQRDPAQAPVIKALDRVLDEVAQKRLAHKSSALGWLFARRKAPEPVRGLYVHGGVGRGKTMLMDIFAALLPARRKRRVHFNAFMADVHDRIQRQRAARKEGLSRDDDPIPPVADAIATESWVLCFDEFSVTDIADAMILSRLFSALFARGVVLVATSNVAPDDLYRDGLNRQLFLPFVELLKRHAEIVELDGAKDFRQEKLDRMPVYVTPAGPEADRMMDEAWEAIAHGTAAPAEITVKGRKVAIPAATKDAARFDFTDLCARPLAARDYLAIVARYPTILVDRIPMLDQARRNEAKRLILLVDTLYDHGARLIASAATEPGRLYAARSGTEAFEFARTASRLTEMQGREWLDLWQKRHGARTDRAASAEPGTVSQTT